MHPKRSCCVPNQMHSKEDGKQNLLVHEHYQLIILDVKHKTSHTRLCRIMRRLNYNASYQNLDASDITNVAG